MEDMQFKEIMSQFRDMKEEVKQIKQDFKQTNKKFEKRFEQIDVNFKELRLEIKKDVKELEQEMNLKFMEVTNKIDENQEINSRQHANIYELIESRFQEGKKDREDLHQGQSALDFKIERIKEI